MLLKKHNRKPDIENLYKVLRREKPNRTVLYELFLNDPLHEILTGREFPKTAPWDGLEYLKFVIDAYAAAGYDYAWTKGSNFCFPVDRDKKDGKSSVSLNEGFCITDRASLESYKWQDPEKLDYSMLNDIKNYLPDGMKLSIMSPGGVLENAISLAGYENLCTLIYDDPELVKALFDNIGSRLLKHYEIAVSFDSIGIVMANDDWGFNTQPFLSPDQMREYVFPWHKKIVETAHSRKIPAILHSCGHFSLIIDDIIDSIGFDGRHSYEDTIIPVEEAYEKWHDRIAIIGGMDVNFLVKSTEDQIASRVRKMLDLAADKGSYALGSGNSIPEYIPQKNYFAMINAALDY